MASDITDAELRAAIMEFLIKKGRWGAHHFPLDTMVNFMARKVEGNGKRLAGAVKELVKEGYLFLHKKGETVSLNPSRSKEIMDYVERARSGI
jgi:hypothetical protein